MNTVAIQNALQSKIDQNIFTGCSLIFGKPFEKKIELHLGQIGKTHSNKINAKTVFDLQSITKAVVTGPLTLYLISIGQIKLGQTIRPALESLGIKNEALERITYLDLLTHSSGLSDYDLSGDFKTPEDLWKHMFSAKPHFTPGSSIEYTDLGYRILGKIVEFHFNTNLENAAKKLVWDPIGLKSISYHIKDIRNVAATPDAHGVIDDEQVHFLGDVLGCDGVFSTAEDLFLFMSYLLANEKDSVLQSLIQVKKGFNRKYETYFDALAFGPKSAGWEINPKEFNYSGKFHGKNSFEKAGGAGTFIWFDADTEYIFVLLTNYGKPKPFDDNSWNKLLKDIGPAEISSLIYETL